MTTLNFKIIAICLTSLFLISVAEAKCYPGLDCQEDLPNANNNTRSQQIPESTQQSDADFLAENARKPNIRTTGSGLQYEILAKGKGTFSPSATDTVTVHYKGVTLDGVEFDSSYTRGAPASFPLNRVIAGWTEGVQLMKEGDRFRFYIPSDLAYGQEGAGSSIGPNETLIFDVELIKIQ
jgi:FKBP-type peptidyl-prolyl cis-trans isomerase